MERKDCRALVKKLLNPYCEKITSDELFLLYVYSSSTNNLIERTVINYGGGLGLAGLVIGLIAGGYVANELMEYFTNAPTIIRYAVDGLAALEVSLDLGKLGNMAGIELAVRKFYKVVASRVIERD